MNYDDDFVSLAHAEDLDSMKKILGLVSADGIERAVRVASEYGYSDIVEFLVCNTTLPQSQHLLNHAVFHGHLDCVRWILSVSDPKAHKSNPLQVAVVQGHMDIFELLYPVSDSHAALLSLQDHAMYDVDDWKILEERIQYDQRDTLIAAVDGGCEPQRKKL